MAKTLQEMETLAAKLLALSTVGKVTMALMLLQSDKPDIAESVLEAALDDLRSKRLLGIERVPLRNKPKGAAEAQDTTT